MKTENLTFIEAVQALTENKAGGARPTYADGVTPRDGLFLIHDKVNNCIAWNDYDPMLNVDLFNATFNLVNPVIPTEERTVTGWVTIYPNREDHILTNIWNTREDAEKAIGVGGIIQEVTIPYRVPVKEKEKKRVEFRNDEYTKDHWSKMLSDPEGTPAYGTRGTWTFEWEN